MTENQPEAVPTRPTLPADLPVPPAQVQVDRTPEQVKIVTYPNIIFLYPSVIVAFIAAACLSLDVGSERDWTMAFLVTLAINFIVLAFDFPRGTTMIILFSAIAIILGSILINQSLGILPAISNWFSDLQPIANSTFFWVYSGALALILVVVFLNHHFWDYYVIESNEILHHHGLFGDLERIPSPGIHLQKEIHDLFEFMLLRSGRLVITPQNGGQAIVLDAVPKINHVEQALNSILGVTHVDITKKLADLSVGDEKGRQSILSPDRPVTDQPISDRFPVVSSPPQVRATFV